MAKKSDRIRARLPRGLADREPAEIRSVDAMVRKIAAVYERYGFDPLETPAIEYTEALGKFLPDEDRPGQGVFSFQDDDDQWLSLRYDLTAPLARYVAENYDRLPKPFRSYRAGWVFRNEKPGPGRFRQFMQLDADTVGSASPAADAEMAMMMADTLDALGLAGKYLVKVGSRKVLDGVLDAAGVADPAQRLVVMRAIDKRDRLGLDGVRMLLGKGRHDDSGDFTRGAELDDAKAGAILGFAGLEFGAADDYAARIDAWANVVGGSSTGAEGLGEMRSMAAQFESAGYADRIAISAEAVRGLEYYTGPVFEAELTFPVTNEKGQEVVFGSIGGGGRYDGLVSRFRSEPVPATGFSIGVSRLFEALRLTANLDTSSAGGPVVVCVMDRDRMADYQRMASELRAAGIRAEMFLGNPKNFGKQLSYADARNAPAAIIEGSQERDAGEVQIKDLIAGKQASEDIEDNVAWRAERPGQFSVKRADLVTEIKKLLARQRGEG